MKTDQKSALTFAEEWKKVDNEGGNLSRAYLERDRQLKELRELAKAYLNISFLHDGNMSERNALRAAIGENND